MKACKEKVDGLRILQYLKTNQSEIKKTDEQCLFEFFEQFYPDAISELKLDQCFKFNTLTTMKLNEIRNQLMKIEEDDQKKQYDGSN